MHRGPQRLGLAICASLVLLVTACAPIAAPTPPPTIASPTAAPTPTATRTPHLPGLQPGWSTYPPAEEILAQAEVRSITIAPDGTLWLGTDVGPFHFDGQGWERYTKGLPSANVLSLAVGPAGLIWAGTREGVARFNGRAWDKLKGDYGSHKGWVWDIAVAPDGALWFAETAFISRFDGKDWINHFPLGRPLQDKEIPMIEALAITSGGDFWLGTLDGAYHLVGQELTHYTASDGLADTAVESLAIAPDGAVWFGTYEGATRFDGRTWTTYTTVDGLAGNRIKDIAVAPDGALWFATPEGVSRYMPTGLAVAEASPAPEFTPISIPTYTPRPTRPPTKTPTPTRTPIPLPEPFHRVGPVADILPGDTPRLQTACDGTPWMVTDQSIAELHDSTWTIRLTELTGTVAGIDADGHVWVVGEDYDEISAWDGNSWTTYGAETGWVPVADTWYRYARGGQCDPVGRFWLVTSQDVRAFDGERWTVFTPEDMGMGEVPSEYHEPEFQMTILKSTADVWIGECDWAGVGPAGGQGARWFDGSAWHGTDSPASHGCVAAIEEDSAGSVWLGAGGVLWRYEPTPGDWTKYTPPEEPPFGYRGYGAIVALAADPFDRLWVTELLCGGAGCDAHALYHVRDGVWTLLSGGEDFVPYINIVTDGAGTTWMFTLNISRLTEEGRETAPPLWIQSIASDRSGRIWLVGRDLGQDWLYIIDPEVGT